MSLVEKLTPALKDAWDAVKAGADVIGNFVSAGLERVSGWWQSTGEEYVLRNFENLRDSLTAIGSAVWDYVQPAMEWVVGFFNDTFMPALEAAYGWISEQFGGTFMKIGESLEWYFTKIGEVVITYFKRVAQFWEAVFAAINDDGLRLKVFFVDIATDIAKMLATIIENSATVMAKIPGMGGLARSMQETSKWLNDVGAAYQATVAKQKQQIEYENRLRQERRQAARELELQAEYQRKVEAEELAKKKQLAREAEANKSRKIAAAPAAAPAARSQGGVASIPPEDRAAAVKESAAIAGEDPTAYGDTKRYQADYTSFLRGDREEVAGRFRSASRNDIQGMVGQFASESGRVAKGLAGFRGTAAGQKVGIGKDVAELERVRMEIIKTMQLAKNASGQARDQQVADLMQLEAKYGEVLDKIGKKMDGTYKEQAKTASDAGSKVATVAKQTADKESSKRLVYSRPTSRCGLARSITPSRRLRRSPIRRQAGRRRRVAMSRQVRLAVSRRRQTRAGTVAA